MIMFDYFALAVFGLCCMAEIFVEQIFAELFFTIFDINRENKFHEACNILNNRENLS